MEIKHIDSISGNDIKTFYKKIGTLTPELFPLISLDFYVCTQSCYVYFYAVEQVPTAITNESLTNACVLTLFGNTKTISHKQEIITHKQKIITHKQEIITHKQKTNFNISMFEYGRNHQHLKGSKLGVLFFKVVEKYIDNNMKTIDGITGKYANGSERLANYYRKHLNFTTNKYDFSISKILER